MNLNCLWDDLNENLVGQKKTQYKSTLLEKRVLWGSIYEALGSLLNSKEPFMLKKTFYNDKNKPFWHKGSL